MVYAMMWPAIALVIASAIAPSDAYSQFINSKPRNFISKNVKDYMNAISPSEWQQFVRSGVEAVNRQKRLETNLLNSHITVENGSLSHAQLLDTLPNEEATRDSDIALKVLKSSLFVYNQKCVQHGISGEDCETYLMNKPLPETTELGDACSKVIQSRRQGHHAFRRLLPRHYKDGFYAMYEEDQLPSPRIISKEGLSEKDKGSVLNQSNESLEDSIRNLALVQWSQFVEQDLSKAVVTSMSNGAPIECCNRDSHKLLPRYYHPACAPLLLEDEQESQGHQSCLNYVRSALAIGSKSNFGAAEQLNQATSYLDLSQLYGFTEAAERKMRLFERGRIKSTNVRESGSNSDLLPMTTDSEGHTFCAVKSNVKTKSCFMAGDSRVNNNPLSVLIYTIFMRNHNRVANELLHKNPHWTDEQIFQAAKAVNIDIYRRIVMNEWLPVVLGQTTTEQILQASARPPSSIQDKSEYEISNEFAVAAIRFYFSMFPNVVHDFDDDAMVSNNNVLPIGNIFVLKEEIYNPHIDYNAGKLDEIMESVQNQRAMKMDASYVDGLIWHGKSSIKPTHADVLAFDIQRGRDHGLQPYVKYLEACHAVNINGWKDLEKFMSIDHINKLKSVYKSWSHVDLIIGGISENTQDNATIGPTFSCILGEQFWKIHQHHQALPSTGFDLNEYKKIGGAELLCLNSNINSVPKNIFHLSSESNPSTNCGDLVKPLRR